MKHQRTDPISTKKNEKALDKRLNHIELALKEINENLKKLNKEIDMTQKIVHVEAATNAIHVEQELKKKISELHREDLAKLDQIVGELQTLREENTVGAYHTRELREEVDDIQKRLKKLEQTSHTS